MRLKADGTVDEFVMNDRCAAGTGRFLELLAAQLGVRLACLGDMAGRSRTPAIISSMCVVFAETEIIGLLASGVTPADIVAGVQASLATRVAAMGRDVAPPIVLTGGVALVPGMDRASVPRRPTADRGRRAATGLCLRGRHSRRAASGRAARAVKPARLHLSPITAYNEALSRCYAGA